MANQRHVDILLRDGVTRWNLWRREEPDVRPNLSEANLAGADLSRAYFREADLAEANLAGADLSEADLIGAHLTGAYLTTANLTGANLTRANLHGASLPVADLTGADVSGADLRGSNLSLAVLSQANLSGAYLIGAVLGGANLTEADLTGADLSEARCAGTNFTGATLTGCSVSGISAWDVNLDNAKQANLHITSKYEKSKITVDNLEVAQLLYVLLHNPKVRDVLDTITSKVVLILGRFSDERKPVLDALREALRTHPNGYIPVLFDFEPQQRKDVVDTVKTLANLARFVIADLTDPHMVRSELQYIVPNVTDMPVQSIIEGDAVLPTEYPNWARYPWFLRAYRYADLDHLLANLTEAVIAPVEKDVHARRLADADSR